MNRFYVYEHWRTDRDECFYVGKGCAGRAYNMKQRSMHHRAICAKVSREGHAVEVRIVNSGLSEACALALEIGRIAFWRAAGADLTNRTAGGEGTTGWVPTPEQRERMKAGQQKRGPRPAMSESTRQKISATSKGRPSSAKGKKLSDEAKANLAFHGRKNLALFQQFTHLGPAASARRVKCTDDGAVFTSASAAARHYGVARSALVEMCLGLRGRKSIGGKHFAYVEV